jgi:hypothetical protein
MTNYKNRVDKFNGRVSRFFQFLTTLLTEPGKTDDPHPATDIGRSYIAISLAPPSPRRPGATDPLTLQHVRKCVEDLRVAIESNTVYIQPIDFTTGDREKYGNSVNFQSLVQQLIDPATMELGQDDSYMILSVLRRPRSHLAYRALLRGPATQSEKDRLRGPAAQSEEDRTAECSTTLWNRLFSDQYKAYGPRQVGGSLLWLPRLRHNAEYNRLTQPGHQLAIDLAAKKTPDPAELSAGIFSLLATAILHRRAARYYFSDVYEATGDMAAFREYIYHRVSYLRTLRRFLGATAHGDDMEKSKDDCEWKTRKLVAHAVGNYGFPKNNPWANLPDAPHPSPTWDEIRTEVRQAWREELGAFRATLSRECDAVLRELYAGTWISITERLIDIDIHEMFDPALFRIDKDTAEAPDIALCRAEMDALVADLRGQQMLARFEMADWAGLLDAPAPHVDWATNPHPVVADIMDGNNVRTGGRDPLHVDDVKNAFSTARTDRLPAEFVKWFMRLLDKSKEYLRRAKIFHELTCPRAKNDSAAKEQDDDSAAKEQDDAIKRSGSIAHRLSDWLDAVERLDAEKRDEAGGSTTIPPFSTEIKDVLRGRLAEHRLDILGTKARFGFRRHNASHETAGADALDEARNAAIQLFEYTRRTVFHDGARYKYFRAQSFRMVARCDYLRKSPEQKRCVSRPIADINRALRLLDRYGSSGTLELLACYRSKAEAYMLWAGDLSKKKKYQAARNRLDAARSAINRAGRAFDRRRRNVPWWLRLCYLRAEWAVASCRLRADARRADARKPSGPEFERELRFGLDAVRAGLDGLIPVGVVENLTGGEHTPLVKLSTRWQWDRFVDLWLALADVTKSWTTDGFGQRWEHANRAARLPLLWKCWGSHQQNTNDGMYNAFKDAHLQ